jgi:hypothetical protein
MAYSKKEAIDFLAGCDHGFLGVEKANEITEPFGFKAKTYLAKANPQDFKGLSLWNEKGEPISEAQGQDAHKIAMQICEKLGLQYMEFFGVGSQLAHCIEVIRKTLA